MSVGGCAVASRWGDGARVRRLVRALVATVAVLAVPATTTMLAPSAQAAPAAGPAAAAADPGDTGWTLAEGKAAVTSSVISRVPGAPAVVDTEVITRALRGTDIRLVMLPFKPLDDDAREAAGRRAVDLKDWARHEQDVELIEVEGLQVVFSIFDVVPDSMAELQPVLAQMDVTAQVLTAIAHLREQDDPPEAGAPRSRPADPDRVDRIAQALADTGLYNDPDLAEPQHPQDGWAAFGDDLTVRAAFLPPAERGTDLADLLAPLQQRFPGDVVVVARGRWIEVAGPDSDLLYSSLLWVYGYYSRGVLGWEVQPASLVRLLAERVGLLRTGVVTDQPSPRDPADPVSSLSRTLPWVFAAVALAIVVVVTVGKTVGDRNRRAARLSAHRAATRDRRALGARLAVLAGQIAGIEPLVHGHALRRTFSRAVERYRVASATLSADGSVTVAREAIDESGSALAQVAAEIGVPLARVGDENPAGDAGAGSDRIGGVDR